MVQHNMYVLGCVGPLEHPPAGRRVLVVDENAVSCNVVITLLGEAGYETDTCSTEQQALEILARGQHRVVVADRHGGSLEDSALVRHIRELQAPVSVILLAGDRSLSSAVASLQAGVFDFMTKSFDLSTLAHHLLDAVRRAFDQGELAAPGSSVRRTQLARDPVGDVLIGDCPSIEQARREVRLAAAHERPVLILGESGTEKAALARLIHSASPRQHEAFEIVDGCALEASTEGLDAVHPWARRGTLFVPELGALTPATQLELIKLLSGLGAERDAPKPRIIAGMSQPPDDAAESNALVRLFERMNAVEVLLPPLRQRGSDVTVLAEHFAEQCRLARGDAALRISPAALEALRRYSWPGNVEELRLAIQHAVSLCADSVIRVVDLPPSVGLSLKGTGGGPGPRIEVQSLEDMEFAYILRVLEAVGGNKALAARLLGVDRTTLYRKLQRQEHELMPASEARRARR